MGKQKQATQTARYAVNKQHARLAREQAAQEQVKQEKRRENFRRRLTRLKQLLQNAL